MCMYGERERDGKARRGKTYTSYVHSKLAFVRKRFFSVMLRTLPHVCIRVVCANTFLHSNTPVCFPTRLSVRVRLSAVRPSVHLSVRQVVRLSVRLCPAVKSLVHPRVGPPARPLVRSPVGPPFGPIVGLPVGLPVDARVRLPTFASISIRPHKLLKILCESQTSMLKITKLVKTVSSLVSVQWDLT